MPGDKVIHIYQRILRAFFVLRFTSVKLTATKKLHKFAVCCQSLFPYPPYKSNSGRLLLLDDYNRGLNQKGTSIESIAITR
jgi:hypothetical protein